MSGDERIVESDPSEPSLDPADPVDALLCAMAEAPCVDPDRSRGEPQPGQHLAHFVVIARLGAGGMGVVYEAEDVRLKRRVALKVLSKRRVGDAASRSLLLREARSAAAVTHPSIAAVYEVGEADGVAFIAMELVRGQTLRARMQGGALRVREAVDVAWEIARGLARAHQAGIVHRDLKPDNVMLGHDGQVKVLDFGLAKPIDPRVLRGLSDASSEDLYASRVGHVAGTPAYMSPEQRYGIAVDARSDVFSFGVLLYEMLTARLPFAPPREGHGTTMQSPELDPAPGEEAAPPEIQSIRAEAPEALEPIVRRCLRRDPAARFRDGVELVEALADARRSVARREGRFGRRARIAAGLAMGALVAIGAVSVRNRLRARAHPVAEERGPTLKRLTANPAEDPIAHAALSPDGQWLAYVDTKGAHVQRLGDPPGPATHIALPDGSSAELVAWEPTSQWLLVSAARPEAKGKDLWRASLEGVVTLLPLHAEYTGIAVSPDGARLAYADGERIAWVPLDGASPAKEVAHEEPGCFITELAWSPDGGRIAYVNLCFRSLAQAAIASVGVNGGARTTALADPRLAQESGVGGLAWTADGRLLYSLAEWFPAENGSNLWSLDVDPRTGMARGAPQRVTSWAGTLASVISVDHAGKRVAFLRSDFQADVYVGDLANEGRALARPQRLTMTDRNERPAAWSADGRGVYFISDRRGLYDVFFQVPGEEARAVIAEPGSETGAQVVGSSLLYWQLPKIEAPETVHPTLMRASGGAPVRVWTATSTSYPEGAGRPQPWEMRFRCARASAFCVLSEKEGEALVFRALDPERGAGRELRRIEAPTAAAFFWDLAPDGAHIAMPQENGPIRIETLGGDLLGERHVPEGCDPIYVTWSADGRGLFVSAECSNAPVFRLYSVGADDVAHVLWDDSPDWLLNTEASPDGKRLAIAVKHADNDVWLLER